MDKNYMDSLLGDLVAEDIRRASVFSHAGIDFCCGGKKTLGQACLEKSIQGDQIMQELQTLETTEIPSHLVFREWDPVLLMEHIINTHHRYVIKTLPDLLFYTQKIASVHGKNHIELFDIAEIIRVVNQDLLDHLRKEEEVLFPAVKRAVTLPSVEDRRIIRTEIARMNMEHESAGEALDNIRRLTGNYSVPADGCNTYHVAFRMLNQFEEDLHIHVHLENNILYPKSIEL